MHARLVVEPSAVEYGPSAVVGALLGPCPAATATTAAGASSSTWAPMTSRPPVWSSQPCPSS
ncbi:hypothetical protein [Blastococcus brunescens]|uniref:Uncharacterized protein n=1 Tax=Blastococcus brunescens TaxID=1564165 RepID=A0ABZ1B8H9_9ACTN|nr:hypothetical protein [Blastococcus sp. BMG 8361]WRL66203.1 hypothetical protein U6N30_12375 [Blastococcus sp. BMG 8361]